MFENELHPRRGQDINGCLLNAAMTHNEGHLVSGPIVSDLSKFRLYVLLVYKSQERDSSVG